MSETKHTHHSHPDPERGRAPSENRADVWIFTNLGNELK